MASAEPAAKSVSSDVSGSVPVSNAQPQAAAAIGSSATGKRARSVFTMILLVRSSAAARPQLQRRSHTARGGRLAGNDYEIAGAAGAHSAIVRSRGSHQGRLFAVA